MHSDHGSQYVSLCNTKQLAKVISAPFPGTVGDASDNGLAESVIGLFDTEAIAWQKPWHGLDVVEYLTLVWAAWLNQVRPLLTVEYLPPCSLGGPI